MIDSQLSNQTAYRLIGPLQIKSIEYKDSYNYFLIKLATQNDLIVLRKTLDDMARMRFEDNNNTLFDRYCDATTKEAIMITKQIRKMLDGLIYSLNNVKNFSLQFEIDKSNENVDYDRITKMLDQQAITITDSYFIAVYNTETEDLGKSIRIIVKYISSETNIDF